MSEDSSSGDMEKTSEGRRSKVERVAKRYGFDSFTDTLDRRWTGTEEQRDSLRDLAEEFNQRVLKGAMINAGMDVLDGEVENYYSLLTDDNVSEGMRVQALNRLEREGVDVSAVQSDFVSHQTIYNYLTKHRSVSPPESSSDQVETSIETIQQLRNRTNAVVERNLDTLQNSGELSVGAVEVLHDIKVYCEDCGHQYGIVELIRNGACACTDPDG